MNILYLSHLEDMSFAGPNYSVPRQIKAQSKYDQVFWYNAVKNDRDKTEWHELLYYHNLTEYPKGEIRSLPKPFDRPDLVVVEGFYNMVSSKLLRELVCDNHSYIIVPRGELTALAQNRKKIKKTLANILICNSFAKKARAIQYLTLAEKCDSTEKWNSNGLIIPNGIDCAEKQKSGFSKEKLICISIGRIEPYQKGLDLLIKACEQIKEKLLYECCEIHLYGPDMENKKKALMKDISSCGLEGTVFIHDSVYGKEKENTLLSGDVFLLPSRFEGHPMALIEALSYGLPCVVTSGSNMKDEIELGKAGWTAETTVESIADALLKMLSEKNQLDEYSERARILSNRYKWDTIAQTSHKLYEQCLKTEE